MKWHPLMIRWCIYLRHLSSRAYDTLRVSGVIQLPSQRTLRDYTYYTEAKHGFCSSVDNQLREVAGLKKCPEREKYVILLMDEMHIRDDIVYDKHTGKCLEFQFKNYFENAYRGYTRLCAPWGYRISLINF